MTGTEGIDLDSWLKEKKLEQIGAKLKQDGLTLDDLLQCDVQEIRYIFRIMRMLWDM